ncbi:hypothetical protein [Stenotrophomonas rhizophila]|uniref:hypothetical protein n=1 Tax=Stenotrophomonas rhizophila TaxID=216778 RepID=UPI0033960743
MLNASVLSVASVVPAELDPTVQSSDGVVPVALHDAPAAPATPLQGRALIERLEQLAQKELAQLARHPSRAVAALPAAIDPAIAGLAWDLGLSGDVLEEAVLPRD